MSAASSTGSSPSSLPPPLPAHAVSLLLSYLSPLDQPLPPHLISTPLRQRHVFLGLGQDLDNTEDAVVYLSWPTKSAPAAGTASDAGGTQHTIADLLAGLPSPENFDPLSAYLTKYTFDGEAVFAHACVPVQTFSQLSSSVGTPGLRLVFRWEAEEGEGEVAGHGGNADGWKYHDIKPMPFPFDAQETPEAALNPALAAGPSTPHAVTPAAANPSSFRSVPPKTTSAGYTPNQYHAEVSSESESDDDAYWNSYGRSGSDDEEDDTIAGGPRGMRVSGGETDEEKAEDAYWARYASVQGTADSTRPSPLASKRKLHDPSQPLPNPYFGSDSYDFDHIGNREIEDRVSFGSNNGEEDIRALRHLAQLNLADPNALSPEALARRLHTISPRPGISPGPSPSPFQNSVNPGAQGAEMLSRTDLDVDTILSSPPTSGSDGGLTLTPPSAVEAHSSSSSSPESSLSSESGSGSDSPPVAILSPRPTNARDRALLGASPTSWENTSADAGLRDTIKGVYRLWAGSRKQSSPFGADEKEAFTDIVRDVLAEL